MSCKEGLMFRYSLLWPNSNGDTFDDADEGSENLGTSKLVSGPSESDSKGTR